MSRLLAVLSLPALSLILGLAVAAAEPGEGGALGTDRIRHEDIRAGRLDLKDVRAAGMKVFTTPFNRFDGLGDGDYDPADPVTPGGRPTLQGNGMFLRVNGLDAQTCLECHAFVSTATRPPTLGIGGVGGSNANAMFKPTGIDPGDLGTGQGKAGFNGRFINPPFLFGSGGVELLGLEMTRELQALKREALARPGTVVRLVTKGVDFGSLVADAAGSLDTSAVVGVDPDLVVRPFGRKGEFPTVRAFDKEAMMFHFGMQPVEIFGADVDADNDGVMNEILVGELSALSIFATNLERPRAQKLDETARRGREALDTLGCTECHKPFLRTESRLLPHRFPEVADDPDQNVYFVSDLSQDPPGFDRHRDGGLVVPLFADLKRHDMGPGLAESFALATPKQNREFTTARLWGVADTAPYLHDGRATTLTDAILMHGGEAQAARDAFEALGPEGREEVLAFLRTLRTPEDPAADLVKRARKDDPAKRKSMR
jgi:hypothetical protein